MIKTIYLIGIAFFLFSCGQENTDNNSGKNTDSIMNNSNVSTEKNKTSASLERYYKSAVPQMVDSLKKRGYKFPSYEVFRNKILEIAHRDIDTASIDRLYAVAGDADAIISERFFLPLMELHEDGTVDAIHVTATIEYNTMIMQNKPTDYNFFSRPIVLEYITMTGYLNSEPLLKKAFSQAEEDRKAICYLLFNYPDTSMGIPRKQPFRYAMLQKMEQLAPSLLTNLPTNDFEQYQLPKDEYYKALCYLLNAECSIRTDDATGVWSDYPYGGQADLYFIEQPEVRLAFKNNNYWALKYIREYDKTYNILKLADLRMNGNGGNEQVYDYVVDKDGYANVRKEPNTTSEVVFKVNSYEKVEILDEQQGFYKIKYNGKEGFVHQSRL